MPGWRRLVQIDYFGGSGGDPIRRVAAAYDHHLARAVHDGGPIVPPAIITGSNRDPGASPTYIEITGLGKLARVEDQPIGGDEGARIERKHPCCAGEYSPRGAVPHLGRGHVDTLLIL